MGHGSDRKEGRAESLLVGVDLIGLRVEDGLDVGHDVLEAGLALGVEQVENDDDGDLHPPRGTLTRKAMTESVRTKEEVPLEPLFW